MRFAWADLQIFLHVCEAGSMTAGAERCHLTLAAVSARIRNLEEANGLALLRRLPRGVVPTPAGEVLAAHARVVFEQVQRLERDLLNSTAADSPRTVLLANSSALARPIAVALAVEESLSQPWLAWGEHGALAAHLQLRALALGARIAARVTYPALDGLLDLVRRGVGVTVLPRAVLERHKELAEIACVPLEDAWAQRRLLVCRMEGGDPRRAPLAERIVRAWPRA